MTRVTEASPATGPWHLGTLLELPRDMHCTHELPAGDAAAPAAAVQCPECRRVLNVMAALGSARPA